jgi:hypothetical protein
VLRRRWLAKSLRARWLAAAVADPATVRWQNRAMQPTTRSPTLVILSDRWTSISFAVDDLRPRKAVGVAAPSAVGPDEHDVDGPLSAFRAGPPRKSCRQKNEPDDDSQCDFDQGGVDFVAG